MKRTKLGRGTPSLGTFAKDAEARRQRDDWRTWAGMQPCFVCGAMERVVGHHVIEAQELRNRHREDLMWDRRNCLPLCRDCHANHHAASRRVLLDELLTANWAFAQELNLEWLLRRTYPAGPVDPTWKDAA